MDSNLIEECLGYISVLRNKPLIHGAILDKDTIKAIATKVPENRDIRELFGTNKGLPSLFTCEVVCDRCEGVEKRTITKTQLISHMEEIRKKENGTAKYNWLKASTCQSCKDKELYDKKRIKEEDRSQFFATNNQSKTKYTDIIINNYLMPNAKFKEGIKWHQIDSEFDRIIFHSDNERISEHIKSMPYEDFLVTPYWRIIASKIRKRAEYRCAMCSSSESLRVHHSNYKFHGLEHTQEGKKSLTCVCDKCHTKHHGIL